MKNNKLLLIIISAALLVCSILCVLFLLQKNDLGRKLERNRVMIKKAQEEIAFLQKERQKIKNINEQLQSDAISYVGINSKLQEEKNKISSGLNDAQKNLEAKEGEVKRLRAEIEELSQRVDRTKKASLPDNARMEKELKRRVMLLENSLVSERALYYYNLGVAYTKVKLFEDAIKMYLKALKFNDSNADAHYNIGILYENYRDDPVKAVLHYRKYLELSPQSRDKEQVQEWIKKLGGKG